MLSGSTCKVSKQELLEWCAAKAERMSKEFDGFRANRIYRLTTIPNRKVGRGWFGPVLAVLTEREASSRFDSGKNTSVRDDGGFDWEDYEREAWKKRFNRLHKTERAIRNAPNDAINASLELIEYLTN